MKNLFILISLLCILNEVAKSQKTTDLNSIQEDLSIFDTPLATKLKKKVSKSDIKRIKNTDIKEVALQLLNKQYDLSYRLADYSAFLSPESLGKKLAIGKGYSQYENITGIYLPLGKHIVLVENIAEDKTVNLVIPNWNRRPAEGIVPNKDPNGWGIKKTKYLLKNGINIIDVQAHDGLAYIDYYSDQPEKENKLSIHFINAKVNGYFDSSKQTNEDWNALLNNTTYLMLDARGKHIQTIYPQSRFKKICHQ